MRRTPLIDEIERLGLQHSFKLPVKLVFRPFEQAKEFARSLKLKNWREWRTYCKFGKKPNDIPTTPQDIYKNKGWVNWKDWLGTSRKPFIEAREFARSLKLKSYGEWNGYSKSGKKPINIPAAPNIVYKGKGWVNWGDWLGTGIVASKNKKFRLLEKARKFARSLKLKTEREWREYYKSGKKPDDIPTAPDQTYKDKGWVNWNDWLGTEKNGK